MFPTYLARRVLVISIQVGLLHLILLPPAMAAPGELDTTFGGDGRVVTEFGACCPSASGVAIQADGKVVVAGSVRSASDGGRFALTRYKRNGALDATFGADGRVVTGFTGRGAGASAVAIQADGKIVAAGSVCCPSRKLNVALARYNRNGALDATFGGDGRVVTGFAHDAVADGVAIQSDGRIVAAGWVSSPSGERKMALARYKPGGALDATFGGDGRVTTGFAGDAFATGVAIQSDGKVVAAGGLFPAANFRQRVVLARYNPSGALDATFGGDGRVTTGFAGDVLAEGLAIQSDGRIVAAGSLFPNGKQRFALVRYRSNGALDASFGGDGRVATAFAGNANGSAVTIQVDGKIVVAGATALPERTPKFALARYRQSGALDGTFGGDGRVVTGFAGRASAEGVAIQPDGRIVAAGGLFHVPLAPPGKDRFALARYVAT